MPRICVTGGIACGKSLVARYLNEFGVATVDADDIVHELIPDPAERRRLAAEVFADPAKRRALEARLHPLVKARIDNRIIELSNNRMNGREAPAIPPPSHSPIRPFANSPIPSTPPSSPTSLPPNPCQSVLIRGQDLDPSLGTTADGRTTDKRQDVRHSTSDSRALTSIRLFDYSDYSIISPSPPIAVIPLLFEAHWDAEYDIICCVVSERETQISRMTATRGYTRAEAEARLAAQMPVAEKAAKSHYVIHNDGTPEELKEETRKFLTWLSTKT